MDAPLDLLSLLPEVQDALCEHFDGVECSLGPGPVLSQPPFRLPFNYLGRNVTFVPDIACIDEFDAQQSHRINVGTKSAVFTDGDCGRCLELALGRGRDWQTPLTMLFDRLFPTKWAFLVAELEQSDLTFHILSHNAPPRSSPRREDTPQSTELSSQVSSTGDSISEGTNFSLWITPVNRVFAVSKKVVKVVKKVVKKRTPVDGSVGAVPVTGDDKKRIVRKVVKREDDLEKTPSPLPVYSTNGCNGNGATTTSSTAASTSSNGHLSSNGHIGNGKSDTDEHQNGYLNGDLDNGEDNNSLSELRKKLSGNLAEIRTTGLSMNGMRKSCTPERMEPIYEGKGRKERSISPVKVHTLPVVCRSNGTNGSSANIPVVALQQVLKTFSYRQLGKLREVHPHWDELAGQMLNSGYYQLLERSDNMLMALQRKLPVEPSLHYPTTVLTNIQVHVLNPIDIMRAVLDEGVCCFPYGVILDKTNALLDAIEAMLHGAEQHDVPWEPVATLAKRAQLHYKNSLERVMEDRLGESLRLKAAQRIIRLDSFIVETTVQKLEKETAKARDDLRWELEQLQQQNQQLKKDNRQLKQDHARLEERVQALEGKFKTLARLLS